MLHPIGNRESAILDLPRSDAPEGRGQLGARPAATLFRLRQTIGFVEFAWAKRAGVEPLRDDGQHDERCAGD